MRNSIKLAKGDRLFLTIVYIFLALSFLIVIYPIIYILSASFSDSKAVVSGEVWLYPVRPTLEGYSTIFKNNMIVTGYLNSIFYTVVGTIINIFMTILAAYPLSRKNFYGKGIFTAIFAFTMLFGGGLIPTYLLIRDLGMIDTRWAMLIPGALSVWNMIIARTYFTTSIPTELYEASEIDGCSDFKMITSIVLPLSKPIIAVLALFYGVGHWNAYFGALIYLEDPKLYPLQIVLRNILLVNQADPEMMRDVTAMQRQQGLAELLKYSLIVVASVPMMLIYPFVQKNFVKGVMIGAVKG